MPGASAIRESPPFNGGELVAAGILVVVAVIALVLFAKGIVQIG